MSERIPWVPCGLGSVDFENPNNRSLRLNKGP